MADKKISALTGATTPLAGTEVLPIVQSGATVKVAVSDLTAGRAVTAASVNKVAITAPATASTLTIADGKTLTVNDNATLGTGGLTLGNSGGFTAAASKVLTANNSLTLAGTDSTTQTFPATSATIARTDAAQTFTGDQTLSANLVQGTAAKGFNFTANTPAAGMTSQLFKWYEEGTWTLADASGAGLALTVTSATYVRVGSLVFVFGVFAYPVTADVSLAKISGLPFTATSIIQGIGVGPTFKALNIAGASGSTTISLYQQNGANNTNLSLSGVAFNFTCQYTA